MSLPYFSYRKDLPLTLRSGLHPIIGKRIKGLVGDAIDIFCGTVFGVSTSLGFGVSQMTPDLRLRLADTVTMQVRRDRAGDGRRRHAALAAHVTGASCWE